MSRILDGDSPPIDRIKERMHRFIKIHNDVAKTHNSPVRLGEAEHMEWARVKYLERGAGAIQFYQWVINGGPEPDFINGPPTKLT